MFIFPSPAAETTTPYPPIQIYKTPAPINEYLFLNLVTSPIPGFLSFTPQILDSPTYLLVVQSLYILFPSCENEQQNFLNSLFFD